MHELVHNVNRDVSHLDFRSSYDESRRLLSDRRGALEEEVRRVVGPLFADVHGVSRLAKDAALVLRESR